MCRDRIWQFSENAELRRARQIYKSKGNEDNPTMYHIALLQSRSEPSFAVCGPRFWRRWS